MAKGSEMSKSGYKGLNCAVCGRPVPLSGESFQAETDVASGEARIWHSSCGRPAGVTRPWSDARCPVHGKPPDGLQACDQCERSLIWPGENPAYGPGNPDWERDFDKTREDA